MQGSGVDSSLNENGRAQADAFFRAYCHVPFDKVYTSNLRRSIESVQQFIELGIPHEKHSGLNEISWGKKEGQTITPDEDAYYHEMLRKWQQGKTGLRIEGGESPDEVAIRQLPVIKSISDSPAKTILICMHGRAMRILLCQLSQLPLMNMDSFEHNNLCLYEMNYSGSLFSIEKHNDTTHLEVLKNKIPVPIA